MEIYLVGGAVRDKLLGLPVTERDWVVVGATPEALLEQGYRQVGKDFPVFLHPDTQDEYALARTERKTAPGYTGFAFHAAPDVTLEDDLKRRDLTINAIAERADGTLIDPYGGEDDLALGRLRHVSPAFAEDPVRILRVARFAAKLGQWGFSVAHATNALMRNMVAAGEVDHLVPERVWAELTKALATPHPEKFFTVLHGCGALGILFPEVEREYGGDSASHGTGELPAALQALARSAARTDDSRVRFAVLLSALGEDLDTAARLAQAEALCTRLRAPNDYARLAQTAIGMAAPARNADAGALLAVMEAAGAFRDPARWQQLLAVYRILEFLDDATASRWERARTAAAAVNAASLDDPTLQGPAIGRAIHDKRQAAIASILDTA